MKGGTDSGSVKELERKSNLLFESEKKSRMESASSRAGENQAGREERTNDWSTSSDSVVDDERVARSDDELLATEDVDENGVLVPSRVVDGERLVDGRRSSLETFEGKSSQFDASLRQVKQTDLSTHVGQDAEHRSLPDGQSLVVARENSRRSRVEGLSSPVGSGLVHPGTNRVEDSDPLNGSGVLVVRRPERFSVGLKEEEGSESQLEVGSTRPSSGGRRKGKGMLTGSAIPWKPCS